MAETYDVALAPHCPLGPIAFAASMQVATCIPNCKQYPKFVQTPDVVVVAIQEMSWEVNQLPIPRIDTILIHRIDPLQRQSRFRGWC